MGAYLRQQPASDAAEILERDYGIDAGEVLSMNVDTVETVTGGTQSDSPDFAAIVNDPEHWEQYGQKTWDATDDGYIYSRVSKDTNEADKGLDVGTLTTMYRYGTEIRDPYYGWWGTALLNNDEYEANGINAKFHIVQGGNLNEGFCFNVNKSDWTYKPIRQDGSVWDQNLDSHALSGYFMTYSHHLNGSVVRALWRIDNWRLDNSFTAPGSLNAAVQYGGAGLWCAPVWGGVPGLWETPGTSSTSKLGETATCLASWTNQTDDVDYEVDFHDGRLQLWDTQGGDASTRTKRVDLDVVYDDESGSTVYSQYIDGGKGQTIATVKGENLERGTYGFWGNNCEMMQFAQVSKLDIQIEKTYVKSFGDIVYEPTWTDGALHMLINIDTAADRTMLGQDGGTESSTRLLKGALKASSKPGPSW